MAVKTKPKSKAPVVTRQNKWSLRWSDPSTSPPAGMPRVFAEEVLPEGQAPDMELAIRAAGPGYVVNVDPVHVLQWPKNVQVRVAGRRRPRKSAVVTPSSPTPSLFANTTSQTAA